MTIISTALLLLLGCGGHGLQEGENFLSKSDQFILQGLNGQIGGLWDAGRAGIIQRLGEPDKVEHREVWNEYSDDTDVIYTLHYPGLRLAVWWITGRQKELLTYVDAFEGQWGGLWVCP